MCADWIERGRDLDGNCLGRGEKRGTVFAVKEKDNHMA